MTRAYQVDKTKKLNFTSTGLSFRRWVKQYQIHFRKSQSWRIKRKNLFSLTLYSGKNSNDVSVDASLLVLGWEKWLRIIRHQVKVYPDKRSKSSYVSRHQVTVTVCLYKRSKFHYTRIDIVVTKSIYISRS